MSEYHFTDTLGQAVEEARRGAEKAAGIFGLLESELKAEREMHRAEKLRLVERAEAAEAAVELLRKQRVQLEVQVATQAQDYAELRHAHAELEDSRGPDRQTIRELRTTVVELRRALGWDGGPTQAEARG